MRAEDVRPLLPVLVHLARFPTANLRVICERWGVAAADVMAAIARAEREESVEPGAFDDDILARAAKRWRVSVPAWQAVPATINNAAPAAAPRKIDKRGPMGPRVAVPEPSPVPAEVIGRPRRKDDLYLKVCIELLLGGGRLSENEACKRHGLGSSTWIYFKRHRLGMGALDPHRLHAVAGELANKLGEAKLPGLPKEWVAPATVQPVSPANGAGGAEPAGFGAKSAVFSEIGGKERRHLVAALAMGVMIGTQGRCMGKSSLEMGYQLYDELVALDRAREGGAK